MARCNLKKMRSVSLYSAHKVPTVFVGIFVVLGIDLYRRNYCAVCGQLGQYVCLLFHLFLFRTSSSQRGELSAANLKLAKLHGAYVNFA